MYKETDFRWWKIASIDMILLGNRQDCLILHTGRGGHSGELWFLWIGVLSWKFRAAKVAKIWHSGYWKEEAGQNRHRSRPWWFPVCHLPRAVHDQSGTLEALAEGDFCRAECLTEIPSHTVMRDVGIWASAESSGWAAEKLNWKFRKATL